MTHPIESFRAAMLAAGLTPPDDVVADGKLRRFSSNGKARDDSGWYVLHLDGIPAGSFGDWREGFSQSWCSKSTDTMTPAEREAHRQRVEAMRKAREADQHQRQQQAAQTAATRWQAATPATEHPYLTAKGVKSYGLKAEGEALLIPMRDTAGKLHSLQVIDPTGGKRFQYGGRIKGCYFAIGKPDGVLIVCEGYATGASIHQATGQAVAVAFNAGNLLDVAQALRSKYPKLRLILAADDDHMTAGNPGVTKATEAARAVGGLLAVPRFPQGRGDKDTDFNDLHKLAGLDAVKACMDAGTPVASGGKADASTGQTFPPLVEADTATEKPAHAVVLCNGADLTPEPVRWLWTHWLALGKMHILAGAPGQGKTTIALAFAATVTIGGRWPDGSRCEPGNVLVWSGEDDPADTLLPRLLAAGADKSRVWFVSGTRINGEVQPFDPARDMAALEAQATAIGGVRLLVVDPVVSAVTGDSHKNTEVRRSLQPIVDLASRLDAAVLGISHFSKGGQGGDPASRVVGSVAFTAVARVVLVAAKVKREDGDDKRILARAKSNIGPDDGGFEYHVEQSETLPGISASYVAWGQSVAGNARELLAEPDAQSSDDKSAVDAAQDFLREALSDGPTPTKTLQAECKDAGVSWASVRRASEAIGVVKRKGDGSVWYWSLPMLLNQLAQVAQRLNLEQVEQHGEQVANSAPESTEDAEVL